MRIVVVCGVAMLCLIVLFVGMLVPDTTEGTVLSWIANMAQDSKREAVLNSIEMQTAMIEIEELEAKLEAALASCPVEDDEKKTSRLMGMVGKVWPW